MTQDGRKIREKIRALLARKDYRPLDKIDIAHKLGLTGGERVRLRKILRELEHSGEIARIRKNRYVLPAEADLVTGTLSIHQAGYGFVIIETPGEPDIFIAAENTGTAMHGDRVVARITRNEAYARAKDRRGRQEGRVIRILERARDTIVGTLQHSRNFYYVVPDDPRLVHDVYVQLPTRAKLPKAPGRGDKVVVRLEPWESRHVNPEGEIIELLGPASAPGVDMLSIIRKYDLPTEFPRAVVDEANRIPETIGARMLEGREDLREKFIVTIDPDDARDFDDAIHVDKTDNQSWRLGVHIADVSAYVNPDSAHRLTYKQAYSILQSAPRDRLSEHLHQAWALASLLRRRRFEHGSLDLDFPEVKVHVDANGEPLKLERVENDESHQLIEECM